MDLDKNKTVTSGQVCCTWFWGSRSWDRPMFVQNLSFSWGVFFLSKFCSNLVGTSIKEKCPDPSYEQLLAMSYSCKGLCLKLLWSPLGARCGWNHVRSSSPGGWYTWPVFKVLKRPLHPQHCIRKPNISPKIQNFHPKLPPESFRTLRIRCSRLSRFTLSYSRPNPWELDPVLSQKTFRTWVFLCNAVGV